MFNQNQLVLIATPIFCDCGKSVWCWFKDHNEHISYTCSCGLKMGEKKSIDLVQE